MSMKIGFDYYVELEDAKLRPVFVKPYKISALRAVENGKRTRITFWDGYSILVEGSITTICEKLFNPIKKYQRGDVRLSLAWQEKTCFEW